MADTFKPPAGAVGNAKKVLDWKEKHGSEVTAMTSTGWARARQLASGKPVGLDTVKRMAAFNRHRKNSSVDPKYKDEPWKDNGYVAWLGWGGTSGIDWAMKISEANKALGDDDHELRKSARRIMKEFSIAENSAGDEPAQAPALMSIMKSRDGDTAGEPGNNGQPKETFMSKTAEELQAELDKSAENQAKLEASLKAAEKLAKMSDDEKSYRDGLDDAEKAKFDEADEGDRKKMMDAKKSANPVIYKSLAGDEYRQDDDPRLVEMAKRDDNREKEMQKMRDDAAEAAFEKRGAKAYAKFKGEVSAKTALAKAVAGIKDDDVRKSVEEMLESAHNAAAVTLKEIGSTSDDFSTDDDLDGDDSVAKAAGSKLDALAKQKAAADKISFSKAMTEVLDTEEGAALYAQSVA